MNKILYTTAIVAVFAIGCSKEPITRPESVLDPPQNNGLQRFDIETGSMEQNITLEKGKLGTQTSTNQKSVNSSSGHFNTPGATVVSFSATVNNGGLHGNINFKGGLFDLKMNTVCLEVYNNQAMVAGIITKVTTVPPGTELLFVEGAHIYFLVEDNGEGSNASADRVSSQLYYSPANDPNGPYCAALAPNSGNWNPAWMTAVGQQGNIQVN